MWDIKYNTNMSEKSDKIKHTITNGKIEIAFVDQMNPKTPQSVPIFLQIKQNGMESDEESNQSNEEFPQSNMRNNNDESPISINSVDDFSDAQNKPKPIHSVQESLTLNNRYSKHKSLAHQCDEKKLKSVKRDSKFRGLELNDPDAFPPSNKKLEDLSKCIYNNENPSVESGEGKTGNNTKFVQSIDENALYRNIKNLNEETLECNEMAKFAYQTKDENERDADSHDFNNAAGDYHEDYHFIESPLVDKKSIHLMKNLKKTNAEISHSENEFGRLKVEYGVLFEKVKKQYQYLMQLKENTFELQMGIDVLNMQLERLNDQQKLELEETRQLEQKKRSLEETFEKQKQSLKRTLEALSKQEIQNSVIRQKIEMTGNYTNQMKEIAQFVEQEIEENRRSESILQKNDKDPKHNRKGSNRLNQDLFLKEKGYSTPKTHTHHNLHPESYLPSNISSNYRLEDPFGTQSKKLDEILELMKTINKVKDPEIHTFRSKDGAGDESNFHKDSQNLGFGMSNLDSNKQINQTFVIFNKTLMDIVKEMPKLIAPMKRINAKAYEHLRTDYSRFSETKIRRLNLQMMELSKRKDAQTESFLYTILEYFKEEREIWKDFLQNLAAKMNC